MWFSLKVTFSHNGLKRSKMLLHPHGFLYIYTLTWIYALARLHILARTQSILMFHQYMKLENRYRCISHFSLRMTFNTHVIGVSPNCHFLLFYLVNFIRMVKFPYFLIDKWKECQSTKECNFWIPYAKVMKGQSFSQIVSSTCSGSHRYSYTTRVAIRN